MTLGQERGVHVSPSHDSRNACATVFTCTCPGCAQLAVQGHTDDGPWPKASSPGREPRPCEGGELCNTRSATQSHNRFPASHGVVGRFPHGSPSSQAQARERRELLTQIMPSTLFAQQSAPRPAWRETPQRKLRGHELFRILGVEVSLLEMSHI